MTRPSARRAGLRAAALAAVTGLALLLAAPSAFADVGVFNPSYGSAAPGGAGTVSVRLDNPTLQPQSVDVSLKLTTASTYATLNGCGDCHVVFAAGESVKYAHPGFRLAANTPSDFSGEANVLINGESRNLARISVYGVAGAPLVSPVIGGAAGLMVLGGYLAYRRHRARDAAPTG